MSGHTAGMLQVCQSNLQKIETTAGYKAQSVATVAYTNRPNTEKHANAARLVACWNALAGIADPAEFVNSRADLLAACKFVNDTLVKMNMEGRVLDTDTYCAIQQMTFAAISRAEGVTP